jgi:hypothetical protein
MVLLWGAGTRAQEYGSSVPTLHVVIDKDYPGTDATASHVEITAGTNHMSLKIPEGYRATVSPGLAEIDLVNQSGSFKFSFAALGNVSQLDADTYRPIVLGNRISPVIRSEFNLGVCCGTGPAYDLDWTAPTGRTQCSRTAYVSSPAGVLEFSAISSPGNRAEMEELFRSETVSFWFSPDGKPPQPPIRGAGN